MIKRNQDMKIDVRPNMRGGDGTVFIKNILDKGEFKGHARLLGEISLDCGCSIGEHIHENEEEIFYIIEGTVTYNDNGEIVTLNAGDSCVCLGGQTHGIKNTGDTPAKFFAAILTY